MKILILATFYLLTLISFVIYSYTQIDLNLTLSSNLPYQTIQQQLIQLGYFNRPLSSLIYLTLIFLLFTFYFLLLRLSIKGRLTVKKIRCFILMNLIFLFAYPAFSYDIFNYIFDARILVFYKANPWTHTALDFPSDPWTRFMHWTHRTYPYGPVWLAVSIFPYFFGLGKFVLSLFNFKLLLGFSYLGSCFLIFKILEKRNNKIDTLFGLTFFAFNPVVLVESLLSPHLDMFMTFLGLLAIFLLLDKKRLLGTLSLFLSILTKYATLGYLPFLLKQIKFKTRVNFAIFITLAAILGQIYLREILPWYFIPLIALITLSAGKFIKIATLGLSLGGTLYYWPYLYFGEYSSIVKTWRLCLFFAPILTSLILRKPFQERNTQDEPGTNEK